MFPSLFVFVCLLALNIFEVPKKCLGLLKHARLTSPLLRRGREAANPSLCLRLGSCLGTGMFFLHGLLKHPVKATAERCDPLETSVSVPVGQPCLLRL